MVTFRQIRAFWFSTNRGVFDLPLTWGVIRNFVGRNSNAVELGYVKF